MQCVIIQYQKTPLAPIYSSHCALHINMKPSLYLILFDIVLLVEVSTYLSKQL